ncbi:MAG: hypothetical protein PSX37_12065 [bacterium]|nr:hypothetical protein [bacterium]
MSASAGVIAATMFTWLGMVLAISFLEAPLKFRAPGVTTVIGLAIGRLVFRALNVVEVILAALVVVACVVGRSQNLPVIAVAVPVVVLVVQLVLIRPRLTARSDRVLVGLQVPGSRIHHLYIVAELVKATALVVAGVLVLTT